jgi:hypothetical protein
LPGSPGITPALPSCHIHNERREEQDKKDEEQDFCNTCRRYRNAAKSEDRGND